MKMITRILFLLLVTSVVINVMITKINIDVDKNIDNIVDFKVEAVRDSLKMMEIDRDMWAKSYVETWQGIEKYCSDNQCAAISKFEEEEK